MQAYYSVNEYTNGEDFECCPQCGSIGIIHFEDLTMTPDMPHRCLRCDWKWDGCTYSAGPTPKDRLNSILNS